MINEAIQKIEEETENASPEIKTLGKYVKMFVLTTEENAECVLKPNTDLETFMERIKDIAKNIHSNKYSREAGEAGKQVVAQILGEPVKNVPENTEIGKMVVDNTDCRIVTLSSEFIIPLLHIYYGIDAAPQEAPKPKRRGFRAVSLDD
ncbi:MAG: hypothetical protein J6C96_12620 [Oscillospiraceae bacterium]|nr:hypothetical protein [Oscillospiraceae bacterium]